VSENNDREEADQSFSIRSLDSGDILYRAIRLSRAALCFRIASGPNNNGKMATKMGANRIATVTIPDSASQRSMSASYEQFTPTKVITALGAVGRGQCWEVALIRARFQTVISDKTGCVCRRLDYSYARCTKSPTHSTLSSLPTSLGTSKPSTTRSRGESCRFWCSSLSSRGWTASMSASLGCGW